MTQPQGFLAVPTSGTGPGVLILHAWWGLNDTIKGFCTRLSEAGFTAFAPDLYHGRVADTIPDAETLGRALDANHVQAEAEISQAVTFLMGRAGAGKGIAVLGFSLGAAYALNLAGADPDHIHSVVLYYGNGDGDHGKSRAAYLGHWAEKDDFEPREGVDELEGLLRKAGRPVTFHHYGGVGHWFAEPDRTDAYNQPAADLAWDRTAAFLRDQAGS